MEEEPQQRQQQQQPSAATHAFRLLCFAIEGNSGRSRLQRYPLRSATKVKDEKPKEFELSNPSAYKRGKPASSISRSVGVLNFTAKEKSASKPPGRLSYPAKASATPAAKQAGSCKPIAETRTRRSSYGQGKSETPKSYIPESKSRRKLSKISNASYWLDQIKLSESAANHSVSLGFFKLALEAGCEPIHLMRDGLKQYIQRYELNELAEDGKRLLESYSASENTEPLVSETCTGVSEEETQSSNDDVLSSSNMDTGKLNPKCLNVDSSQFSTVTESTKKATSYKNGRTSKSSGSLSNSSPNTRSDSENIRKSARKIAEKPKKVEPATKEKGKINKKQEKKSVVGRATPTPSPTKAAVTQQGIKENMVVQETEETSMIDVV